MDNNRRKVLPLVLKRETRVRVRQYEEYASYAILIAMSEAEINPGMEGAVPHKRRERYKGTHPHTFKEKYKELNPENYREDIA